MNHILALVTTLTLLTLSSVTSDEEPLDESFFEDDIPTLDEPTVDEPEMGENESDNVTLDEPEMGEDKSDTLTLDDPDGDEKKSDSTTASNPLDSTGGSDSTVVAVKEPPNTKGMEIELKELGGSDKDITPSLKKFLKSHRFMPPKDIFVPDQGEIDFPFAILDDNYAIMHIYKLHKKDQADGYLILLDISNTPTPIDTIGPFFNLVITGVAYTDILADSDYELIVNYEYDLVTGQTMYKKKGTKHMPFFQFNKGPKPPKIIDIDGDGKFEVISSLELENTSKGSIILGEYNQYWNDVYTYQNGSFTKNNRRFKSFLEKNISDYEDGIRKIKTDKHIQERVSFMERDPRSNFIKDLRIWITTIQGL